MLAKEQLYSINPSSYLQDEYVCFTEWIIEEKINNNKPFKPINDNLKSLIISFDKKMSILNYETKNYRSSIYFYEFINTSGEKFDIKQSTLGLNYRYVDRNNKIVDWDIFEDGKILVWRDHKPLWKLICPNLKLDIKKIK